MYKISHLLLQKYVLILKRIIQKHDFFNIYLISYRNNNNKLIYNI
jgi:hypothetical protein